MVLLVLGDNGVLNLTAYNSTTVPSRLEVTIEH